MYSNRDTPWRYVIYQGKSVKTYPVTVYIISYTM